MGDPMMTGRGTGGMPPSGGDPIKDQMSIFHPTDALLMGKSGQISSDQTIAEGFAALGLDVNKNTMKDLSAFVGKQVQNANPSNKMKNFASIGRPGVPPGAPGAGTPPPPAPPQGQGGGTLEDLMG